MPAATSQFAKRFIGVAALPVNQPLPEPWYAADYPTLACDLCGDLVDALWPLSSRRGSKGGWYLMREIDLYICRRCAHAIRPPQPSTHSAPSATPGREDHRDHHHHAAPT